MWIGNKVTIPLNLTIALAIFTIIQIVICPYSGFINGLGKIKLTMSFTFLEFTLYFILIFVFGHYFTNSTGIVLAIICTRIIGGTIQPIQTYKILNGTAEGVWNK